MLYLDDAMKVLLYHGFIDDGYIDEDGNAEVVRNELEQKCYLREPIDLVRCKDCKLRGTYGCPVYVGGDGMCSEPDDWFCADGERRETGC